MDLKFKGITWFGNIYYKFEAMCQEVDGIMSQDSVKFVENQEQIVEDLHPPLVVPVKCETQAVALKSNAANCTHINSVIGIEENPVDTVIKQSPMEPNAINPVKNQPGQALSGLHVGSEPVTQTSVDSLEGAEFDLTLGEIGSVLTNESSDVSIEENAVKKSSASELLHLSTGEKRSFEASSFNELIDNNHENTCGVLVEVSPATLAPYAELQSPQNGVTVHYQFADDSVCVSDASSTLTSSEMAFSVGSSEKTITEMELMSTSYLLTKPFSPSENLSDNFSPKAVFCHYPVDVAGCVADCSIVLPSSTSVPIISCKNKVAEFDLTLGEIGSVLTNESSDVSIEENAVKKSSASEVLYLSTGGKRSFEASSFSELIDNNHENTCGVLVEVSPATLAHDVELQSPQKGGTVHYQFADDSECVSDASSMTSSEMAFSLVSLEKTMAEVELLSTSYLLTKPYSPSENLSENFPPKAVFCHNPVDVVGCVSDYSVVLPSSTSVRIVPCRNKVADMGLVSSNSVMSLESIGVDTSRRVETVPLTETSGNRHVQFFESAQTGSFVLSSDIGHSVDSGDDINDPSMETIELHEKVKLEESCVIVDDSELYAVSRRARKLRSYKKKILDAFSSKKRLAKEYEQLAIWYGDSDTGSSQGTLQISWPSTPTTPLDVKNLQTHHISDSEWELL